MLWPDATSGTSERTVTVGEVIDIRLARGNLRRQAQAVEARIAALAGVAGRHRVASEPEEAKRAALEAVCNLFAAAAGSGEVIAVARPLEDFQLLLGGLAGERIARTVVEREQLCFARRRDRERGHELGERLGVGETP